MAMEALPAYFRPDTHIEGINAPDLHTLNSVLGATIEDQAVAEAVDIRPSFVLPYIAVAKDHFVVGMSSDADDTKPPRRRIFLARSGASTAPVYAKCRRPDAPPRGFVLDCGIYRQV
jgi:hypothetical protein